MRAAPARPGEIVVVEALRLEVFFVPKAESSDGVEVRLSYVGIVRPERFDQRDDPGTAQGRDEIRRGARVVSGERRQHR